MQIDDESRRAWLRRAEQLVESDGQVHAAQPHETVTTAARRENLSLPQVMAAIFDGYAERPALGERAAEYVTDASGQRYSSPLSRFDTITYAALWQRVQRLAAAWHLDSRASVCAGDFIAILGFSGIDYVTVDVACMYLGVVSTPLPVGASALQSTQILAETEPRILATTNEQLDDAVHMTLTTKSVRTLVVLDFEPDDDYQCAALQSARTRLIGAGVLVETLGDVLEKGKAQPAVRPHTNDDADALALLIYTSGSTGNPKGAMFSEELISRWWRTAGDGLPAQIRLNYLPLSHVGGRGAVTRCLAGGGTLYFAARSDMSTLLDDIALVRPTTLFFVPRLCELLFQRFHSELGIRIAAGYTRERAEQSIRRWLRDDILGGRILAALCGGAPLAQELRGFMESVLGTGMLEDYSATETVCGITINNRVLRPPILDYKLVDVPELEYFGTDAPHPRGELLVRSDSLVAGYYKDPTLTAEIIDAEGFFHTGDIVAEEGPDHLRFIERRTNVLKLSQGRFVSISRLEAIYASDPSIEQIYLYGSGEYGYLLAVIVPGPGWSDTDPQELHVEIQRALVRTAQPARLEPYEIPRDFLIETVPFTSDNGLLSSTGKPMRANLRRAYGERLDRLYEHGSRSQPAQLRALRRNAATRPVLETVIRATHAVLGGPGTTLHRNTHFTDVGGDSLSALTLSTLLTETFGVEVPVSIIVDPTTDLVRLADRIALDKDGSEPQRSGEPKITTHDTLYAADLMLDRFIDSPTLAEATAIPAAGTPPRTVLLTGATGYLGRFLCLEWLRRLADSGGTLICLVRGDDAKVARYRLDAVFDGDDELARDYRALAAGRLCVLAGDVSEPRFGLDESQWCELADQVELIVHAAAMVNHVLSYDQLFGPNVVGTAETIRLALTRRRKPLVHLSTTAIATHGDPHILTEYDDIRRTAPSRAPKDTYANGYGNSKWAAEVLLRRAHDVCRLPVAVFRPSMVLAHRRYTGQLNVPDQLTRLLLSVLATGLAPQSFYQAGSDGQRIPAHYDGLPVDFVATVITALGARTDSGISCFNVVNPHDDGISLDRFVDWLIDAGHPIERVADYDHWLSRFRTALDSLPELQRRHSVLPLLHAFRHPIAPEIEKVPDRMFRTAIHETNLAGTAEIPWVTPELICKYATDLTQNGLRQPFIFPPQRSAEPPRNLPAGDTPDASR